MTKTAYVDESVRRAGVVEPTYILAAYLPHDDGTALADALTRFQRGGKLHWRDEPRPVKRDVCRTVAAHDATHLIVAAAPIADDGEEAARQVALATLLVTLATEHVVRRVVMERRQVRQDMIDVAALERARRSRMVPESLTMVHVGGRDDARLWPDQVAGAYGDHLTGDSRAWELLVSRVSVRLVPLR